MIEAMACGTPVLAFDWGSVPEVIDDGVTGRVVSSIEEAVAVLPQVVKLDRRKVRQRFEKRFSVRRMANDYLRVYQSLGLPFHAEQPCQPVAGQAILVAGDGVGAGLHAAE
jgi:glycosyltransferase involved in cell wall biosynthesis